MPTPHKNEPDNSPNAPMEPTRVKTFASFFKNYMSISAVLAAALPIPVTSFKLIPIYDAQTSLLATYTSLFCFLLLGFIFYSRHAMARVMFPEFFGRYMVSASDGGVGFSMRLARATARLTRSAVTVLPALLIAVSLACAFLYHVYLDLSLAWVFNHEEACFPRGFPVSGLSQDGRQGMATSATETLQNLESWQIPYAPQLMLLYLGIFLLAESAFIIMALKEYLQDLVKLSEKDLITGPGRP